MSATENFPESLKFYGRFNMILPKENIMKTTVKIISIMLLVSLLCLAQINCNSAAQYDIRGTWSVQLTFFDATSEVFNFTFTGTRETGVVTHTGLSYPGTYTVDGDRVEFSIEYNILNVSSSESYDGNFDNENTMSGNFEWDTSIIVAGNPPIVWAWGTFTATRM
jgi:hypothetical protein